MGVMWLQREKFMGSRGRMTNEFSSIHMPKFRAGEERAGETGPGGGRVPGFIREQGTGSIQFRLVGRATVNEAAGEGETVLEFLRHAAGMSQEQTRGEPARLICHKVAI